MTDKEEGTVESPYLGMVIEVLTHGGQEIAFRYAHRPPCVRTLRTMVEILRREADDLEGRLDG